MANKPQKQAKSFGKKEKALNYASNTYQLTRPSKVGAVMSLIRACQPKTFEEWETFYFEKAYSKSKNPTKVTRETLDELGERLYAKITEVVIPLMDLQQNSTLPNPYSNSNPIASVDFGRTRAFSNAYSH